jgi:hypothetical protein
LQQREIHILYETSADNDTAKIKALYKSLHQRNYCAGGDGTIKLVALESEDFVLGILPGSSNGLVDLGLPKAIESCQLLFIITF